MEENSEIDALMAQEFGGDALIGTLMKQTRLGHLCIEGDIEGDFVQELKGDELWFKKPIGKWRGLVYFQRNWVLETAVVMKLKELIKTPVLPLELKNEASLNIKQKEAARKALSSPIFCLTGGPGTGKTHTINEIVKSALVQGEKVIVGAPTGKAIAQLKKRLGLTTQCGTLHALLKAYDLEDLLLGEKILEASMVIIDECSMIDVGMLASLFKAIQKKTRLILVGDPSQLPPVETGTLYGEIATYMREHHPNYYAHLSFCMRSDQKVILEMACAVKEGRSIKTRPLLRKWNRQLWKKEFLGPMPRKEFNKDQAFEKMKVFRLLSCLSKGPFGFEILNQMIFETFQNDFFEGAVWPVPVMVTRTDYCLNIANGEMGILLKHTSSSELQQEDMIYFEKREIPAVLIHDFQLAYAISVHKSQGSEYEKVVLIVPRGSEVFGREILYTGITRARQNIEIYAEEETLALCLSHTAKKMSGIRKKLAYGVP